MKYLIGTLGIILVISGWMAFRATSTSSGETRVKVLQIVESGTHEIADSYSAPTQVLEVEILSGPEKGSVATFTNDYVMLKKGDRAFVAKVETEEGARYVLTDPDRVPILAVLFISFILLVVFFGGLQGVRGLIALAGSFLLIGYLLLPGILNGYPVLLVTIGVSALIIILGSYITHGFNKTTTAAVIGMIGTVIFTGILSYIVVNMARFNGITSDEDFYLNNQFAGGIDLVGLLLGGMVIGLLGVLYDAAISQAIAVEELHQVAPHLDRKVIFSRAIRIGREHIGALVDTLAIAYVGVSLPLLLLFMATVDLPLYQILNQQIFATEIIRILIGSIGLVLAVPITTALSVWILMKEREGEVSIETLEKEQEALKHFHHHH
ncbi:MAG: YibE/F family protein [Minisyncoccia bacterium]